MEKPTNKPTNTPQEAATIARKRGALRLFKPRHLTRRQSKVMDLLADGSHHTAANITIKTGLCDPRSVIRDLRANGVEILDYWELNADNDGSHKRFYLSKEAAEKWNNTRSI